MVSIFRCNEQKENTKGQTFRIYEDKEQQTCVGNLIKIPICEKQNK